MIRSTVAWIDDRVEASSFARSTLRKVFPDHWSFLLGEVAMYSFVILIVTGVFLTFFYDPGATRVVYDGSYEPMRGVEVSRAYESVLHLSFDVRAGLVMRQTHHWAALVFAAAIAVHAVRVFFTGAFRRPRELNWIIGLTMLILVLANGFFGISLADDVISAMGVRIAYAFALSVPLIGPDLAFAVFGGEFPSETMFSRFFTLHILIIPALIAGLLGAHLALVWRQTHTQFPGGRRREHNVVGDRFWPAYLFKSTGLFLLVAGVLFALGGLAQINPVWLYGPFDAGSTTIPAQPDWYLGWVEGALRIIPPVTLTLGSYEIPSHFFAGILLPLLVFAVLYAWPFAEARITGDRDAHHLLDRPRDRPVRTAIGAGGLGFLAVLLFAGSHDLQGQLMGISVDGMTVAYQVAALTVPPTVGLLTWKTCRDLARRDELHLPGAQILTETPLEGDEDRQRVAALVEVGSDDDHRLRRWAMAAAGLLGLVAVSNWMGRRSARRRR
jgi:ubiquinol-cytochrome c reductase cytochrome b subunit